MSKSLFAYNLSFARGSRFQRGPFSIRPAKRRDFEKYALIPHVRIIIYIHTYTLHVPTWPREHAEEPVLRHWPLQIPLGAVPGSTCTRRVTAAAAHPPHGRRRRRLRSSSGRTTFRRHEDIIRFIVCEKSRDGRLRVRISCRLTTDNDTFWALNAVTDTGYRTAETDGSNTAVFARHYNIMFYILYTVGNL